MRATVYPYVRRTVGRNKIVLMLHFYRVTNIHIDNGFLRKDESEQVVTSLQQLGLNLRSSFQTVASHFSPSLTFYDASTNVHDRQTLSLCRTVNLEEKRRIIGDKFLKVVDRTANDLNVIWDNLLLGQVALIPDLIESTSHMASSRADTIKTHHNDSEMVRQLRIYGRVVEPLKGRVLGLSTELLERHPFPGPGLSIRILYAEELFMEADFVETQVLIRLMVDYANMAAKEHALLRECDSGLPDTSPHPYPDTSPLDTSPRHQPPDNSPPTLFPTIWNGGWCRTGRPPKKCRGLVSVKHTTPAPPREISSS
ncbi:hypothetical protein OUZ56_029132 [Daphnia magna]|uniref:GMPS ATP-PPase domain-containing protein n=1 Tax=Daphnia magna TaxID=35525 RepID=A0ABR0B5Z5_9CRUS|nr:hypothetical protein OUZ56_029132 [Daphnia magna]